jgi:hypothetical protein
MQGDNFSIPSDTCLYYKKAGHYMRKCPKFLQYILENGKDHVTFVDESLYLEYPICWQKIHLLCLTRLALRPSTCTRRH